MSPILIRPIREQIEHDRIIRVLHARLRGEYNVESNLGDDRRATLRIGPRTHYPDIVLTAVGAPRKVAGVIEVETAESVNHLEAMAQWAHFGRTRAPFYLYVPVSGVDIAKRLIEDYKVSVTEMWSYAAVGDRVHFWLVRASAASTTAAGTEFSVPVDGGHLAPRPDDSAVETPAEEAVPPAEPPKPEKGTGSPKPGAPTKAAAKPAKSTAPPAPAAKPSPSTVEPRRAKPEVKAARPQPKPAIPAKPAAKPPAKAAKPAVGAKKPAGKPAKPVKPVKPARPVKPVKPAKKATAPARSSKQAKAAKKPVAKAVQKASAKKAAAKAKGHALAPGRKGPGATKPAQAAKAAKKRR